MYKRPMDGGAGEEHEVMEGVATGQRQRLHAVAMATAQTERPARGTQTHRPSKRRRRRLPYRIAALAVVASSIPTAVAQSCISLRDSTECPAFNASSISTDRNLVGLFPFLSSVTDIATFDSNLRFYIANGFTQERYGTLIGCNNVHLDNTTAFYARYTTSVLCNAIIQNSITPCGLTGSATRPLCANACASYAQSEEEIASSNICQDPSSYALTQIRADFVNCALPAQSLATSCIAGVQNQPNNCGFGSNLGGLCSYCSDTSPNSTDSCCVFSNTTTRCTGVTLPIVASSSLQPVTVSVTQTSSATSSSGSTSIPAAAEVRRGPTGGQIAGVVIGSVLGALLLLGLIIFGCLFFRRRSGSSPSTSVFNQPATGRQVQQPPMAYNDGARDGERAGLAILPGGRVARMSAIEGDGSDDRNGSQHTPLGYGGFRKSTSDEDDSPETRQLMALGRPPKRSGSLSSGSQLAIVGAPETMSPQTPNDYSSPDSHGQSEQLSFFKDYYSQDEIHPSDIVSTLWAYEPRAADEFHLERGDMIKVLGIWDDGWATGVRVRQQAEDWRPEDKTQRDSGMSGSSPETNSSPESEGEVKAFPLVCVCLPQHWRKTIEGESTEESFPQEMP